MSIDIQLHKNDLPDDLDLGNLIAVDGEFMGLNVARDPLCLIQISSGNSDAHIVQFDRENYNSPNLVKILNDDNEFDHSSCVVIVFPDHGSRYLSKIYSDEWMNNQGFYDSSFYQPKKNSINYI